MRAHLVRGERALLHLPLADVGRDVDLVAHLPGYLHDHRDVVDLDQHWVGGGPICALHVALHAEAQPQLLADERSHRVQHAHERADRFTEIGVGSVARVGDLVGQHHQLGDRGVESESIEIVRHTLDRAMRRPSKVARPRRFAPAAGVLENDPPHAREPPIRPLRRHVGPVDVGLERPREQHGDARAVGAVPADDLAGGHEVAAALRHRRAAHDDHALVEQFGVRLVERDEPDVVQHLREEARVDKVTRRMRDAARVVVGRHPVLDFLAIGPRLGCRARVPEEVPRRIDERVERIGLASRRAAARRTRHVDPVGLLRQRRLAGVRRAVVLEVWQQHGQLVHGDWDLAVFVAQDHRDRATPVPLTRDVPVAQPVTHAPLSEALFLEPVDDFRDPAGRRCAVERTGVHHEAATHVRLGLDVDCSLLGPDHLADRQPFLSRELTVALVVRGHRHDRAGAVLEQHVVRDPDRDVLTVDRVDRARAAVEPLLALPERQTVDLRPSFHPLEVLLEGGFPRRTVDQRVRQRMLGRQHHERRAPQRVRTGREDLDALIATVDREDDVGALRAPDPVALDSLDVVRPAGQLVQSVEQPLRKLALPEEPRREVALRDCGAATLTPPVDDLLVGKDGLVVRAPVDRHGTPVRLPGLVELQEQPLRPPVEIGIARVEVQRPVEGHPDPFERAGLLLDVRVGPLLRVDASRDGRILGRQPERVPADRMQHVEAAHPLVARDDVAPRKGLQVPHVEVSGGIRKHVEAVILRLG